MARPHLVRDDSHDRMDGLQYLIHRAVTVVSDRDDVLMKKTGGPRPADPLARTFGGGGCLDPPPTTDVLALGGLDPPPSTNVLALGGLGHPLA